MARIPYVSREDLPADKQSVYDHIAETRGGIDGKGMPNSFRLLMNSPDAAEAVGALGEHIRLRSTLHPAFRETAILGVARALDSQNVWGHPTSRLAPRCGSTAERDSSPWARAGADGTAPKRRVTQGGKEYMMRSTPALRCAPHFSYLSICLGGRWGGAVVSSGYDAMRMLCLRLGALESDDILMRRCRCKNQADVLLDGW